MLIVCTYQSTHLIRTEENILEISIFIFHKFWTVTLFAFERQHFVVYHQIVDTLSKLLYTRLSDFGNILVILEQAVDIFLMYDKLTTMEGTLQVDEYQMLKTIRHRLELDLQKEVWSLLSIYFETF